MAGVSLESQQGITPRRRGGSVWGFSLRDEKTGLGIQPVASTAAPREARAGSSEPSSGAEWRQKLRAQDSLFL